MFLWKNAVVLVGLLGVATLPMTMLVRERWEKRYIARLVICGALIACLANSALPMLWTQLVFMVLLVACFDPRVPMAGTWLFFSFWTPAAGSLLAVAGAYIAPITPFVFFSLALLLGFLIHPENHLRRRLAMSDIYMLLFILAYCVCMSLRAPPTTIARNIFTYFIPYLLTYQLISRMKIVRPELLLRLMLFGAAAAGLLCLFETVRQWPLYSGIMGVKADLWTIDSPRVWLLRGGISRAYGPFAHPLTGGAMLGLAAIGAWGLWQLRGRSGPLAFLSVAVVAGLAATLSRSGLVALAVGIMVYQLLRGRYLLAVAAPVAGLAVLVGLPILGGADAQFSTDYRLGLITGVPEALGSRVWLGYREAISEGLLDRFIQGQGIVDLVNVYLALIVEGGLVSLAFYVVFLLSAFPHYRAIRRLDPDPAHLTLARVLISIQAALLLSLALLSSWVAPMQISFVVVALLVALRTELTAAHRAARPVAAPLVATLPVDQGERLPALR
ncbi:hypothetical protein [Rhizorhabdus dicambivorans]|uniref:O-antigen ligase domain-containing protein n=1 Tax=Rhizorhabdus dicambivorans TaxID=1850238 RepID=A0A2A4FXD4_9SPHN|nr:hypothetical protein [Rhizorhabdus dicambivorans]ATE66994.1 hypothetical protein CMV14_23450 [Rhizorhabdus dicambivorans]PCE42130.1 hypothetical protein COO09_10840 [Rhizorhabdus dicambivorans]